MKVSGWEIDNFGVLSDYSVHDLPPGITVFLGPNESGKSTLLGYLRSMIFGFSGLRGKRKQKNLYPAIREGRHGGRLFIETDEGLFTLDRTLQKPVSFTLTRPDGSCGTESDLQQLLGSMDRMVYETVFAFSLDELAVLKTLNTEGVGDKIFSASLGLAGEAARTLIDTLTRDAEKLYAANVPSTEIQRRLGEIEQLHQQYLQALEEAEAYPQLLDKEKECRRIRNELDEEYKSQAGMERDASRLIDFWVDWEPALQLKAELDALPAVDEFVESPDERLQQAKAHIEECRGQKDGLQGELEGLTLEWDSLVCLKNDALFEVAAPAEKHTGFEQYQERCRILASSQNLIDSMKQAISRFFERTGSGWDADKLCAFDTGEETRKEVRSWQARLDTVETDRKEAEQGYLQARLLRERAQKEREDANEAVREALEDRVERLAQQERELKKHKTLLDRREAAAERIEAHENRRHVHENRLEKALEGLGRSPHRWSPPVFLAASVCFLEIAVWQILSGAPALGSLEFGFSALIAAAALKVSHQRKLQAQKILKISHILENLEAVQYDLDEARTRLELLRNRCATHARRLSSETDFGEEAYEGKLAELESFEKRLQAATSDEKRTKDLLQGAEKTRKMIRENWDAWVKGHEMTVPLSPREVTAVLDGIEDARQTLRAIDEQERFLAELEEKMESWAAPARALLQRCDRLPQEELCEEELVRSFEELLVACQEEVLRRERMKGLEPCIMDAREARDSAEKRFTQAEEALRALLNEAGVEDEKAYMEKRHLYQSRLELKSRIRAIEDRIEQRMGEEADEKTKETVWAELNKGDTGTWQETAEQARAACGEIQARRDEVVGDLREAERAREALEASVDLQNLALRFEGMKTELARRLQEWRVLMVEKHLVEQTLETYLENRQPAVLKAAGAFFSEATGGQYTGLSLREDGKTLVVRAKEGIEKSLDQLSLGTAELLYLCIRFGLVSSFGANNTCLPMIMDDVLVNFDPQRAGEVARLLKNISQQNQILFFTCHPQTVELLQQICSDVRVEHLARNRSDSDSAPDAAEEPAVWPGDAKPSDA
ncbi:MAG: AAA family ATPase [Planctomycetota bacterium]